MSIQTTERGRPRPDPLTAYPRPPFPRSDARQDGSVSDLEPTPDHGESSYVGSGRLAGARAIITGGDSGIGRAAAIAFAREGADVAIAYLEQEEDARETASLLEAEGQRVLTIQGDVGDPSHAESLVRQTVEAFGGIDILVNNAATQKRRDAIEEISLEEWEHILQTNLTAPFLLCRAAVPHMPPGGSIINVASIQAVDPSPSLLAYATTKGGLVTFSKGLSGVLAPKGIRVNVIAPGPVWTPLVATTTEPAALEKFGGDTPLGRPAQPVELAGAFVYLASPESSYMTGAVIALTGGEFFQ